MKKLLLLSLALVMVMSVAAYGQGGAIMLYSDPAGTTCSLGTNPAGTLFIYLYHSFTPGTTASGFRIQQNNTNFIFAADLPQQGTLTVGDSNVGGDYAYGVCRVGPFNFLNVLYSGLGTALPCSFMQIVAKPSAAFIEGVDCDDNLVAVDGSRLTVNDTGDCDPPCGIIVPVRDSNWGQIKALYN